MDARSARRIGVLSGQLTGADGGIAAQAGLDYHKEAALQHAGRSLALAARGDPRLAVPDPPAFARPALDRQTLENKPSKRATRTEATADTVKGRMGREVAVSRTLRPPAPVRDGGWKPRVLASESARAYFVSVALPGAEPRSLRVHQAGRRLTVSGSRGRAGRADKGAARFAFAWDLPADVNLDAIVANVYDGADGARPAAGAAPWLNIALLKHKAGG